MLQVQCQDENGSYQGHPYFCSHTQLSLCMKLKIKIKRIIIDKCANKSSKHEMNLHGVSAVTIPLGRSFHSLMIFDMGHIFYIQFGVYPVGIVGHHIFSGALEQP